MSRALPSYILAVAVAALAASCHGCPGPKWEGTEALVTELECGMSVKDVKSLVDREKHLEWHEDNTEPHHRALHRGNTTIALDFDESDRLVSYEVFWVSGFMYSDVDPPVVLCDGSLSH